MGDTLVRVTASFLERRTSRRGFLARAAAVGGALVVAPGRYLLHPESAWAVTVPADCSSSARCRASNYTEFCCSLFNRWGKNYCPSYSYIAGWWKCNDYRGQKLCATDARMDGRRGNDHRYYVDCNRLPSNHPNHQACVCKCTGNKCHYRRTCCNVFKYGNCNNHVQATTEVVCRVVRCENPGTIYEGCSVRQPRGPDEVTCTHEAACNCGICGRVFAN